MADYTIVAGDLTPVLSGPLSYSDGTTPDLTGATVNLVLRNPDATVIYLNKACTVSGTTATYTWGAGDTAVAGDYVGEFVVTFADGTRQSFPGEGYFTVTILPALTGSVKPRASFLTAADLIWQARGYLDGRTRPVRNKLNGDLDATTESFSLQRPLGGAVTGAQVCIGLETMYVWDTVSQTLTVDRGADGTIPAQHKSGDTVLINPEFTDARILQAINQELAALPSEGLWAVRSLDRTINVTNEGYDLASDVVKVVDVRWQHTYDTTDWTALESFEVQRNMPTTSFPSGIALFLPERPYQNQRWYDQINDSANNSTLTHALRVRYWANLTPLTSLYDDVLTVTGIPDSAVDILAIGAAVRLMAGRPVQRVSSLGQADPRNNLEVKAGDVLNAPAALRQLRAQRIQAEADKLRSEWTYRKPARRLMGG